MCPQKTAAWKEQRCRTSRSKSLSAVLSVDSNQHQLLKPKSYPQVSLQEKTQYGKTITFGDPCHYRQLETATVSYLPK